MVSIIRLPFSIRVETSSEICALPALSFDPDRFLDERLHKYLTPNPFIFLPFNAGPRICLGQQVCSYHLPRARSSNNRGLCCCQIVRLQRDIFHACPTSATGVFYPVYT